MELSKENFSGFNFDAPPFYPKEIIGENDHKEGPCRGKMSSFFKLTQPQVDELDDYHLSSDQWNFVFRYYPEYAGSPLVLLNWLKKVAEKVEESKKTLSPIDASSIDLNPPFAPYHVIQMPRSNMISDPEEESSSEQSQFDQLIDSMSNLSWDDDNVSDYVDPYDFESDYSTDFSEDNSDISDIFDYDDVSAKWIFDEQK